MQGDSPTGKVTSFWMQYEVIEALERYAQEHGITRNAALNEIVREATGLTKPLTR